MAADGTPFRRLAGEVAALGVLAGVGFALVRYAPEGQAPRLLLALALVGIVAAVVAGSLVQSLVGGTGDDPSR